MMQKEMCFRAAFEITIINEEEQDPKRGSLGQEFQMAMVLTISVLGSCFVCKVSWRKLFFLILLKASRFQNSHFMKFG